MKVASPREGVNIQDSAAIKLGVGVEQASIERLAIFLARLHPAWRDRLWSEMSEGTRELFREEARMAAAIYEGRELAAQLGGNMVPR